jgi:hypothetical protein
MVDDSVDVVSWSQMSSQNVYAISRFSSKKLVSSANLVNTQPARPVLGRRLMKS